YRVAADSRPPAASKDVGRKLKRFGNVIFWSAILSPAIYGKDRSMYEGAQKTSGDDHRLLKLYVR
ncbi:MAG: hypothetical protein ACLPPF_09325, partial [Rhodomicrobium sp.]